MINISSNFDADGAMKIMMDAAVEQFAQAAADRAIEMGVETLGEVDAMKFDLSADTGEIDLAQVERRAREILRDRLS